MISIERVNTYSREQRPAEFSLVTVRKTRIDQLIAEGHRGARTVRRALNDPDSYIAATQLGITMASLALGWIGEPSPLVRVNENVPFAFIGLFVAVPVPPMCTQTAAW